MLCCVCFNVLRSIMLCLFFVVVLIVFCFNILVFVVNKLLVVLVIVCCVVIVLCCFINVSVMVIWFFYSGIFVKIEFCIFLVSVWLIFWIIWICGVVCKVICFESCKLYMCLFSLFINCCIFVICWIFIWLVDCCVCCCNCGSFLFFNCNFFCCVVMICNDKLLKYCLFLLYSVFNNLIFFVKCVWCFCSWIVMWSIWVLIDCIFEKILLIDDFVLLKIFFNIDGLLVFNLFGLIDFSFDIRSDKVFLIGLIFLFCILFNIWCENWDICFCKLELNVNKFLLFKGLICLLIVFICFCCLIVNFFFWIVVFDNFLLFIKLFSGWFFLKFLFLVINYFFNSCYFILILMMFLM